MTNKINIDENAIRKLAKLLREEDLDEIEYHEDDKRIRVNRQSNRAIPAASHTFTAAAPAMAPIPESPSHSNDFNRVHDLHCFHN